MNKKFVKENKKPLREFLSAIVAAIVAGKASGKIDRAISKNPELKKQRDKVQKRRNNRHVSSIWWVFRKNDYGY